MSSIPTRRATRSTRAMKDAENAVARPTRAASLRVTSAPTTRATAPTAASKAKALASDGEPNVGKRKREALAEVPTGANKLRAAPGGKGKEKEGAVTKPTTTTTTRVVRRAASTAPAAASRIARATTASVASEKKPLSVRKPAPKPPSTNATQVFSDTPAEVNLKPKDEDDGEARRAYKRRHMDAIEEVIQPEEHNASQLEADKIANELVQVEPESLFEPETQLWDDLDADDWDDPVMVSEYVADVCKYWKELELATLPKANYMNNQTEINWEHRGILVDWIIQVHARFNLLPESLFLTVNLIDRFLSARPISLNKLQLVGLACFFIATKFEETCAPSVTEIVFLSDNQYTMPEVLKAEMYILRITNWDLRCPGPMNWLRRGSKADDCDVNARTVAKYLCEISCLERRLIGIVPSLIAAAGLWLGRMVVGREDWHANLEHYTTYSEKEIFPIATVMLEYIIMDPVQHESLYTKYAHKRYMKCSAYMRQWALERWLENSDVHLERDIDAVKEDIRQTNRELAAQAEDDGADFLA